MVGAAGPLVGLVWVGFLGAVLFAAAVAVAAAGGAALHRCGTTAKFGLRDASILGPCMHASMKVLLVDLSFN